MFVRSSNGTNVSSERVYTTSAPGNFCSIIFPNRSATSRHRSFSINPVGPIVPVSCPPWPASITILPIFKPSARVSVDCPSRVGCGALAGRIKSGFVFVAAALTDFDFTFVALGRELRVAAEGLLFAAVPPIELSMALFEFAGALSSEFSATCCVLFAWAVRTGADSVEFPYKSISSCGGLLISEAV